MNVDYPTWQDRVKAALDESSKPKSSRKPAPPTRADLLEPLRTEVRDLTLTAPGIRGRPLVLLDQIPEAKK